MRLAELSATHGPADNAIHAGVARRRPSREGGPGECPSHGNEITRRRPSITRKPRQERCEAEAKGLNPAKFSGARLPLASAPLTDEFVLTGEQMAQRACRLIVADRPQEVIQGPVRDVASLPQRGRVGEAEVDAMKIRASTTSRATSENFV
jgi:hypothetical protein